VDLESDPFNFHETFADSGDHDGPLSLSLSLSLLILVLVLELVRIFVLIFIGPL